MAIPTRDNPAGGSGGPKVQYNGSVLEYVDDNGDVIFSIDPVNRKLSVPSGSTFANAGTAAHTGTQVGFYGATPVVQGTHVADPAGGATVDAEARTAINAISLVLSNLGLTAAS